MADWQRDRDREYWRDPDYTREDEPERDWQRTGYDYGSRRRGSRMSLGRTGSESWRGQGYQSDYGRGQSGWGSDWERRYSGQGRGQQDRGYFGRSRGYGQDYGSGWGSQGYEPDTMRSEEDWEQEPTWTYTYAEYWLIPGPFTGVGPQGYQRSDDRIREDVNDRLTSHGQIDARDIEAEVNNCEVTLRGTVPDRRTKRAVEDLVESVMGVKDIHNQLRVRDRQRSEAGRGQQHSSGGGQQQSPGGGSGQQSQWGSTGAQGNGRNNIRERMKVTGADGQTIGTVNEIRSNEFLVIRAMGPGMFVPMSAVKSVESEEVRLNVRADQIERQGWATEHVGQRQGQSPGQQQQR
jgi:hypothetical protein